LSCISGKKDYCARPTLPFHPLRRYQQIGRTAR
jgi:hypothetical protein